MWADFIYSAIAIPVFYGFLNTLGRLLKRRAGVPLGASYVALSLGASFLAPAAFVPVHPEIRRFLLSFTAIAATFVVLRLLRAYYWEGHVRRIHGNRIPEFVRQVLNLALLATTTAGILYLVYDYRIPGLLAGSGIVAIILGLAVQDLLGNVIAGYAVHSERAFRPGDWLLWDRHHAQVVETNWRATRLRTNDDIYLDIPNSLLAKSPIVNFTYPVERHALRVIIPVDREAPPNQVKDALQRAARGAQGVAPSPPPKVFLVGFGEWSADYEIKVWLDDHSRQNDILDSVRTNAWYELRRAGFRIPQPAYSIQLQPRRVEAAVVHRPDVQAAFSRAPLLGILGEIERRRLAERAVPLRFGRGERIVEQDEPGSSMFLLLSGTAEVIRQPPGADRPVPVGRLSAGDCFGEMSLLTGERRSATVTATTDCEVLEILKADFGDILREHPSLAESFSALAAQRRLATELAVQGEIHPIQRSPDTSEASILRRLRTFFEI